MLASSLVHGVYAGDSREISMRHSFPAVSKALSIGSLYRSLCNSLLSIPEEPASRKFPRVGTFRNGLSTIVDAIVSELSAHANVELRTDSIHG